MGNIRAHAECSAHVIAQLSKVLPDEDYLYLELGNYLTDVSQFRDPFAYFSAKKQVINAATFLFSLPIVGLPIRGVATATTALEDWIKDLLGEAKPDKRYTGALALFFTHFVAAVTHQLFGPKCLPQSLKALSPKLIGPNIHCLTPEEVDRVLRKAATPLHPSPFTQYYPHEHLDLPPYKEGPQQSNDPLYQPYQPYRGQPSLIRYLEEQIQYISEELSKVEFYWVRSRTLPASHESRHDLLIHLGHVLHAVEDYFFHSNFIEIYQWGRLQRKYPLRRADNLNDREWLLLHGLEGSASLLHNLEGFNYYNNVSLRRKFARRLRYPVSRDDSKDATTLVYTGGFESNDMYHTIHDGLGHMEEFLSSIPGLGSIIHHAHLTLFRVMFSEEERQKAASDEEYMERLVQQHRQSLRRGVYRQAIDASLVLGITDRAREELQLAFQVDQRLEEKYKDNFPKGKFPGVGGFLIAFLAQAQKQVEKDKPQVQRLNQQEKSILDKRTDNGASEEQIGTHSLLAKDSKETQGSAGKQLFRDEVVGLAKHASAALAVLLAERVNSTPNPEVGLDWDSIVRYYVKFPYFRRGQWEEQILTRVQDFEEIPDVNDVSDRPNFRLLGPGFGASKLQQRRNGNKAKVLEKRYQDLEVKADR